MKGNLAFHKCSYILVNKRAYHIFGGVWLGCVRWVFVFRRLCVTYFDSIPGFLQETRSLLMKQRLVSFSSVLQWCFAHRVRYHSSTGALRLISNTRMKYSANCERAVCAVFQVGVWGFTPKHHFSACIIWRETFDRQNCALHRKRTLAKMLHLHDVAQTLPFQIAFGSVGPRETDETQIPNAHIRNQTPPF